MASSFARRRPPRLLPEAEQAAGQSTMTRMMIASVASPRKNDSTAANSRMRMIGLVNWLEKQPGRVHLTLGLEPVRAVLLQAQSGLTGRKPLLIGPAARKRSDSGTDQKGFSAAGGSVLFIIGIFHLFAHKGMACPGQPGTCR